MVVEEVKEIVVTHMAMAFLVTKICLFIIGPKKREGKLMRIAKSTRNFKSQDMIKKKSATNSSWLERLLQIDFTGFTGDGTSKQTLSFTNMHYKQG